MTTVIKNPRNSEDIWLSTVPGEHVLQYPPKKVRPDHEIICRGDVFDSLVSGLRRAYVCPRNKDFRAGDTVTFVRENKHRRQVDFERGVAALKRVTGIISFIDFVGDDSMVISIRRLGLVVPPGNGHFDPLDSDDE